MGLFATGSTPALCCPTRAGKDSGGGGWEAKRAQCLVVSDKPFSLALSSHWPGLGYWEIGSLPAATNKVRKPNHPGQNPCTGSAQVGNAGIDMGKVHTGSSDVTPLLAPPRTRRAANRINSIAGDTAG